MPLFGPRFGRKKQPAEQPGKDYGPELAAAVEADPLAGPVLRTLRDEAENPPVRGLLGFDTSSFGSKVWKTWRRLAGVKYDRAGEFVSTATVEVRGGRDYVYRRSKVAPFAFRRYDGTVIEPRDIVTDGGSIPRIAWWVPGLDPWLYFPAYLVHDWQFIAHHCLAGETWNWKFEEVNQVLGEAIYTLMLTGQVPQDWRVLAVIVAACSSPVGRRVWEAQWSPDQCRSCLYP